MRKNKTLRLLFVLIASLLLFNNIAIATPMDSTTARKVATNFYNWKSGRSVDYNHAQLVYTRQIPSQGAVMQTSPVTALYVFDFGGHFVITSADSRVTPVLGYSTESGFNADNISEGLEWLLNEYVKEIDFITQHVAESECEENVNAWKRLLSGETPALSAAANSTAGPLLSTKWNQNNPYNSQCPSDPNGPGGHAYAGCVACAMAQIIRFWTYPSTGIGSHSYNANFSSQGFGDYGTQSVNFSEATYDFSLMPLTLNNATQAQIDEVAKLMYHCGVSADMMYSPGGSAAYDTKAVSALRNHFGFEGAVLKYRSNYNATSWTALIKNELSSLRPVYYSGSGTDGHAFICDGYDDQDLFHINWGWGGLYDGYFSLSDLTPGNNNFSFNHAAIIGIDASVPKIHPETHNLSLLSEANSYSAPKKLTILATSLPGYIIATATGSFRISNDGINFYTNRTISSSGGTIYVRYQPSVNSGSEHGSIVLSSGNIRDTVLLTGSIYDNTPYCLPPTNLSLSSQNLQDINLQWEAPTISPDPQTLTWAASYNIYFCLDPQSPYKATLLQRYCDTDLVAYHNRALTSISFYYLSGISSCKVVVYKGGGYSGEFNPGTQVCSQDVNLSSLTPNSWNTITLNTPITVDVTQELWFGIYLEAPANAYCISLSTNSMPNKGCILGRHSSGSVSWSELFTNRSFCIRGTVENMQTLIDYQVSRDGTLIGTTTATGFQDHVSSTDTYTYTVTANWSNDCAASAQKAYTNVASIAATPGVLDFFSGHGFGTLVKTFIVGGNGLTNTIQATVSGNFQISADGTSYSTNLSIPSSGGTIYVKYTPLSSDSEYETGQVTLTSGNLSATVSLSGQSSDECNPPQNLTIAQSGNNIMLGWNEPEAQIIQQQTFSWLNSFDGVSYSLGSGLQHYMVHRFEPADLLPYHGKHLTAVSFIPEQNVTAYKVVVYQGGSLNGSKYLNSGTKILEQDVNISTLSNNTWNTIQLNQPVTIDASQELWYGIYMEAPSNCYPIRVGTPYVAKKGLIMKSASSGDNYWSEFGIPGYCFALKATVEDAPISLINYKINRNEDIAGTTNNTAYNDPILYNGEYNYEVWAVWSNGCQAAVRDGITVSGLCDPAGQSFTQTACDNYSWNGTTYTQSGIYIYTHTNSSGCPVTDTLQLILNHGTHNVETEIACESFEWHGITYTKTGIYTYEYTNADGCASVDTLHLTIHHGTHNTISESACASFVWHGQNYTTSGIYTYVYTNADGCESCDTLHLTVYPVSTTPIAAEICEGSSYDFFGQQLSTAGIYTHTLHSVHGCDSVISLTLAVNPVFNTPITAEICEGSSYDFFGQTLTTAGTYTHTLQSVHGCDSVISLTLTVNPVFNTPISAEICEGSSYDFFGQTLTSVGTYTHTLQSVHGCDSVITLTLTVNPTYTTTITAEICKGNSYDFFGETLTTTGTYSHTLQSIYGCDSITVLHLFVNDYPRTTINVDICHGASYHFGNTDYTISGIYYDTTKTDEGCDSITVLHLFVNDYLRDTISVNICHGNSYHFGNIEYAVAGTYSDTTQTDAGCDSITVLHLFVNDYLRDTISVNICHGASYHFGNTDYAVTGTYSDTTQTDAGCDSITVLHLFVNDYLRDIISVEICHGTSYHFGNTDYAVAGTYSDTTQTDAGCDSITVLHLSINDYLRDTISVNICNGTTYHFGNTDYTIAGTYADTTKSDDGCDSITVLHLSINDYLRDTISVEICHGTSYHFGNTDYAVAGTYSDTTQTDAGCDSITVLHLSINDYLRDTISVNICNGTTYHFGNTDYTIAGTYADTTKSDDGCDSITVLHLTVNPVFNTPITAEICEGGSHDFFGQSLTNAGTYTHTLQSVHGCDSVVSLTLTVNPVFNTTITAAICEGGSYDFFGQTLTNAGTYTHTLQSVHGCDSMISLTLTVNDVINTSLTGEICEGGSYDFFGQTLTSAGTYTHTLQSVHGCDSVITLTLSVNPVLNTSLTAAICEGSSYDFFGQTLTTAGTYTHTLQSIHGCDSVITLTLTVNDVINTPITAEICEGSTYDFFGQTLTTAGTYTHTLQSVHGCDSVITLTLTVNPVFNTSVTAAICEGGSYDFFGQTLTTAGTYTHTLQSVHGCDSVISLTLTVNPVFNTPITAEICEGDSYDFFGQLLTTAGTYTQTLQSVHGCDSVISLTLTVNPIFNTPITAEICEGGSYDFFGQQLTTAGTFTHTLQSVHGCDSVISLTLTVKPVFNTPITAAICEGGTYDFFGQTLTTAGTYTHTLQSIHGCDSVVSLTLTVNPVFNTSVTAAICEGGSYDFFGQALTSAGTYIHTLQSVHGCDSVVSLTLTVNDVINTPITAEICEGGIYDFFGQTLTNAGTYTHTLQSVHGCDSVVSLSLAVNPVFNTPISAEICEGSSYDFFGQALTSAGTYTHTLQSVHGCDSVITLTLSVNPVLNTSLTAAICEGSSYDFFGQSLTTAGAYSHTLQSVHGCDSIITLTLSVNPVLNTSLTAEICEGSSYEFFGQTLTTAGTYTHTLQSVHGCDSVITLTLSVNPVLNTSLTAEICERGSYEFFGQALTSAGTYTHTLQSVHGCDSVVTLTLTVNPVSNTTLTAAICEGSTYEFFGQSLTTAGTYTHTMQSIHGCDSVISLTLTVNDVINTSLTGEICEGETYDFFGQTLTTAGTYTHTMQSIHGCDSVITLTLTVNPVFNTPITAEICEGGSYDFFGQQLTTAGTYTHTLQSVHGCDSVITLTLSVNPVLNTSLTAAICEGGSYDFFGQTLSNAGTYTHTMQSVHGCDSVISLTLTVNPVFNTPITAEICEGGSYDFFGQQLTTAGTYTHTMQSVHGCDSVITLTLAVNPVLTTLVSAEICEGGSYDFFGQTLTTAGTYTHTLQSIHGCDSVISLTLTVNPVFTTPVSAEICEGSSYNFFGQTLTTADTYAHTLQSVHGCDSIVTLTLTVNPVFNTPLTAAICEGGSYDFFGQTLTTPGTYSHTLQSVHGCDSVISLTLTVNDVINTPITAAICEGGSYDFFGQQLTTAGTYTHTLQSVHGCDSVITLTLSVNPVLNTSLTAAICEGSSYDFFGQSLTSAGTYAHTLQSVHGCDSIVTLTLTVNPVFNTPLTAAICEGGSYDFFGQTLTTAGTYTHTLQSVHGCDSVISLTLAVNDVITTPITAEICEGSTYEFFGQTLTTAGTYTHTLQSVHGCDSVITLTLTVNPVFTTTITAAICEGSSYDFFGQTLTTAGTYTHTLQSVHGCDSVISLTLTVNPVFNTPITAEICEGDSYDFFGQTLTTAGTYTHTLQSVHGCDSVISLTLTVNPVFTTPLTAEICEGGSYEFFGQTLTTAGTYTHTLQSIHGCDSVVSLTLTVNPVFNTPLTAEICEGSSYEFFGQALSSAGTYTHTLQSIHGCDSVITLTLSVNPVLNTSLTAAICEGGSYDFFGQQLTTAGTYTHTLQSVHGCDSVVSLTLTVNPVFTTSLTGEICEGGSYDFFGQTLTTGGTYTHTLQSVHGCDSVISLTLTVLNVDSTDFTEVTCDEYTWNGVTYTTSGDYPVTFTNVNGCDSTVTLHLTINPSFDITVYDTAVRMHEYTLGDFQITPEETGTFTYDLTGTTETGCDSTVHLILTVMNNDGIPVIETTNVEIFPNPAHATLNIKGGNMQKIIIYNSDGQTVYSTEDHINDLIQVDVTHYAAGQYLVKIIFDNKQSVTKKVVFNRK